MTRVPCYISAPYGDPDPNVIEYNIQRAEFIGRLAVLEGRAPLVVPSTLHGVDGGDDDPAARRRGMACDLVILGVLALSPSSELWTLTNGAGFTSGMEEELACWVGKVGDGVRRRVRGGTWEDWRPLAERHGLTAEWERLRVPPAGRAAG